MHLLLEAKNLLFCIMHSWLFNLLEDGLIGPALEDGVVLHQGLGVALHCNAGGRNEWIRFFITWERQPELVTPQGLVGSQVNESPMIKPRGTSTLGRSSTEPRELMERLSRPAQGAGRLPGKGDG